MFVDVSYPNSYCFAFAAIAKYLGPRFVSETLYQMVDEQRPAELLQCFATIVACRRAVPQCFIEESPAPGFPKIPLTREVVVSPQTSGDKGQENTEPASTDGSLKTEWHHGELYGAFLTAYVSIIDRITTQAGPDTHLKARLLLGLADAAVSWEMRLLPAFFEKCLDEIVNERIQADLIVRLLLYTVNKATPAALRYLLIPVIELAKIVMWSNPRTDGLEAALQTLLVGVITKSLEDANKTWMEATDGALHGLKSLVHAEENDGTEKGRAGEGAFDDLLMATENLLTLLIPPGTARTTTLPHHNGTPFLASAWLLRTMASSSLAGAAIAWSVFLDPLVAAVQRDMSNPMQGGPAAATARIQLMKDLLKYFTLFTCRWLPRVADPQSFRNWIVGVLASEKVTSVARALDDAVSIGSFEDRLTGNLRQLEALSNVVQCMGNSADLRTIISHVEDDLSLVCAIVSTYDSVTVNEWLQSYISNGALGEVEKRALLTCPAMYESLLRMAVAGVEEKTQHANAVVSSHEQIPLLNVALEGAILASEMRKVPQDFPPVNALTMPLNQWHRLCVQLGRSADSVEEVSLVAQQMSALAARLAATKEHKALRALMSRLYRVEPEVCVEVARLTLLESKCVTSLDLLPTNVITEVLENKEIAEMLLHKESLAGLMQQGPSLSASVFLGLVRPRREEIAQFMSTLTLDPSTLGDHITIRLLILVVLWAEDDMESAKRVFSSLCGELKLMLLSLGAVGLCSFTVAGTPLKLTGDDEARVVEELGDGIRCVLADVLGLKGLGIEATNRLPIEWIQALWLLNGAAEGDDLPNEVIHEGDDVCLRMCVYSEIVRRGKSGEVGGECGGMLALLRQMAEWIGGNDLTEYELMIMAHLMCEGLNCASRLVAVTGGGVGMAADAARMDQLQSVLLPGVSKVSGWLMLS